MKYQRIIHWKNDNVHYDCSYSNWIESLLLFIFDYLWPFWWRFSTGNCFELWHLGLRNTSVSTWVCVSPLHWCHSMCCFGFLFLNSPCTNQLHKSALLFDYFIYNILISQQNPYDRKTAWVFHLEWQQTSFSFQLTLSASLAFGGEAVYLPSTPDNLSWWNDFIVKFSYQSFITWLSHCENHCYNITFVLNLSKITPVPTIHSHPSSQD